MSPRYRSSITFGHRCRSSGGDIQRPQEGNLERYINIPSLYIYTPSLYIQDRTAKLWRLPDLTPVATFRGHKRGIWSVEFSPTDQVVGTASADCSVRLWSLSDGSCLRTFEGHTSSVLKIAFVTAGTQLLSTGSDGLLKLWSVKTSENINTFDEHLDKVRLYKDGHGILTECSLNAR
jgi:WD40 repeat protein